MTGAWIERLSTHLLDTTVGAPAAGVSVLLSDTRADFHIPVLASTFSYSTYLGS